MGLPPPDRASSGGPPPCGCRPGRGAREALRTPGLLDPPKVSGRISIDSAALRAAPGCRGEIVEAKETSRPLPRLPCRLIAMRATAKTLAGRFETLVGTVFLPATDVSALFAAKEHGRTVERMRAFSGAYLGHRHLQLDAIASVEFTPHSKDVGVVVDFRS